MQYIIQKGEIKIRFMEDEIGDYDYMAKWLSNPEVLDFYEGRSKSYNLEDIIQKFGPRVRGEEAVVPCIIEYKEVPIGYVQYYETNAKDYEIDHKMCVEQVNKIMDMDIVIGETDFWNKGIGTKVITGMIAYLFAEKEAEMIWIDPITSNKRAIRCYEKSGFKKLGIMPKREMHDGVYKDSCIMGIQKIRL